jgi:hypothetical protein
MQPEYLLLTDDPRNRKINLMVEDVSIDTHHACWIIMVAMDGEYRQANIEVRVLIVDMPKSTLPHDSVEII